MFYDLNVPYVENKTELQRTLSFLAELDYNVVALNFNVTGTLPGKITCAIPDPLPFPAPASLTILRRATLLLTDAAQNYRLALLAGAYDILALRPAGADVEKALRLAAESAEVDLISLDCSVRYPFHFRPAHFAAALQRGLRIELTYAAGVCAGPDGAAARRNLIANAASVVRATRGRGVVLASEARRALECRAPFDVVNLAAVWGLGAERGRDALARDARAVVVQARARRVGFAGVVDVVYGGQDEADARAKLVTGRGRLEQRGGKRAAPSPGPDPDRADGPEPVSKSERKRRAKRARQEAAATESAPPG